MLSHIVPHSFVALRLPSGAHKVLKLVPDTVISLGKYGSFPTNLLFGRPYHLTFEVLDKLEEHPYCDIQIVPASELNADALADDASSETDHHEGADGEPEAAQSFDLVGDNEVVLVRSNRLTIDDPARQALTMAEIEELKKSGSSSGKDIIAKIMQSHLALDEKTTFSLAKYTLRKSKKYMRRFTVLPLDVTQLTSWMINEKDPARVMEIREEMLGLMLSWSNVHYNEPLTKNFSTGDTAIQPTGRWLVIDDTGGLIVAALAERMNILHPQTLQEGNREKGDAVEYDQASLTNGSTQPNQSGEVNKHNVISDHEDESDFKLEEAVDTFQPRKHRRHPPDAMSAINNTITLIHPATQPNLSILSYFLYDPTTNTENEAFPSSMHPLHTHLKTISWLQLLHPEDDSAYIEPEKVSEEVLSSWKSSKRGTYHRKRRRWDRTRRVVEETRAGGFDSLVIATAMDPISVLRHTVPLLRGGAPIVVYSPNSEVLAELTDAYSSARKTEYLKALNSEELPEVPSADFPVDPRLVLAPSLQTVRAREWQVLAGRSHPTMTSRGGAEGFLFTGTRVLPVEGKLEARGKFTKKRKLDTNGETQSNSRTSDQQIRNDNGKAQNSSTL